MSINLSRVNLNLLVALDALLKEQNVTRAGERLFITQSAMSNTLKQLREVFDDPLFVRGRASKMVPTAFALSLQGPLVEFLAQAERVFAKARDFVPSESDVVFRVGMSDYAEMVILPQLLNYLQKHAPNIEIDVRHINYLDHVEPFELGHIDMAIGIFQELPPQLDSQLLFEDHVLVVGQHDNPYLQKPLDVKTYADLPQVAVVLHRDRSYHCVEQEIIKAGFKRKVICEVSHVMPALFAVAHSDNDLVTTVPSKVIDVLLRKDLFITQSLPIGCPVKQIKQVWHKRTEQDSAHIWLRKIVCDLMA